MAEKGLLATTDRERGRNVVRWAVVGEGREGIHLRTSTLGPLSSPENVPNVPNVPDPQNSAGLGRSSVGRKPGGPEKTSQRNGPETAAKPASGPIGTNG